ncbi:SPOR domain-containing protein [Halorhodospira halochloris]|uniref:SPOR domain-containing protein n=1 Tax=Halorhodospira halochloris TaxID=1052 RepID=UPI001EE99725|nr:SPOR domain-containing protein [Halorhodospira halochloris]MCG5530105.1 SPOR domain-containing protein [Halorhodospira halochloris]
MDSTTKRQLVGAAVIVALAVIFLPMFFSSPQEREQVDVPLEVPPRADSPEADREPQLVDPDDDMPNLDDHDLADAVNDDRDNSEAAANSDSEPEEVANGDIEGVPIEEGAFAVQVGSFREQDNAYGFRDQVRDMGMPAYVDRSDVDGSAVYRVRLGPVMERDRADEMLEQARTELEIDGWVISL